MSDNLGTAKTSQFMLGSATVMIGAQNEVFDLNPDDHGIGLVKNFRITGEPSFTDLTQGVKNTVAYSVMTGNTIRASMEAYEYNSRNIAYSMGLEGSNFTAQNTVTTLTSPATTSATSITVDDETGFAVGDYVMIEDGEADQVYVRKLTGVTVGELSFAQALAKAIASGATVKKSNMVSVGSTDDTPFFSAKIVGSLADKTKMVILCPKIRITNGFSLGFTTEGFDNMPYEWSFYDQLASDPFYSEFRGKQAKLLTEK